MAVHRRISGLEFCPGLRWLARAVLVAVSIAFLAALPAKAVEPDEVLRDAKL